MRNDAVKVRRPFCSCLIEFYLAEGFMHASVIDHFSPKERGRKIFAQLANGTCKLAEQHGYIYLFWV